MKGLTDPPPERGRRKALSLRRLESNVALGLAGSIGLLWLLSDQSRFSLMQLPANPDLPSGNGFVATLAVIGLIALNFLFVAAETAIELLRPLHVRHIKENGRQSERLQKLLEDKTRYVAAASFGRYFSQFGLVLAVVILAVGLEPKVAQLTGLPYTGSLTVALIAVGVLVALLDLILGHLVPKSWASLYPHRVSIRLYRFVSFFALVFSAPAALVTAVATLVTSSFGGRASFAIANQAEEEIKTLVESAQETGEIEVDEKELLHSVFEFTDTVAREVMTPRVDLDAMPVKSDPELAIRVIQESGHSRIPLYEETDDQIVGIIHAKDLLMAKVAGKPITLRSIMRPALFVPENKNLHELLSEMRVNRSQLAVVQDEFGGTAGIVTIEDIVEELVGDIVDEYDVEEPEIVQEEDGWLIGGKAHVDDVNDAVGAAFESVEFDTIGGFVFGLFGRQPRPDETIEADGYLFRIVNTDGRRILRLKIEKSVGVLES